MRRRYHNDSIVFVDLTSKFDICTPLPFAVMNSRVVRWSDDYSFISPHLGHGAAACTKGGGRDGKIPSHWLWSG